MKQDKKSQKNITSDDKANFLLKIGHELRTPLNTILGYTQLLNNLETLSPLAKEYLSTIIENEITMIHLLNDVFELLKYYQGSITIVNSEVDPKKLVQDLVATFKDSFKNKLIYLKVNFIGDIPALIKTDPTKLTHILSNLIANGLKFTRKGGVTLNISYQEKLIIDVEDTGIGIEKTEQDAIFPPIDQSINFLEILNETGLGLFVARIFAQMLGGEVSLVRSSLHMGSVFRLEIDAQIITDIGVKKVSIADYTQITGIDKTCKVLLVDDVDINLAMLEIFLTPAGFDVRIAKDGHEAIEEVNTFAPDIIFMDLLMPRKDGFEATKEIKSEHEKIPIIALTASLDDAVKESALKAGVNGFMTKPFIPERFFEIIADHTNIKYIFKDV